MLLLREVKLVAKDHSLLLTLLIAPLLYAFFYGSIYSYKTEEEVPIAVVDEDHTGLSRLMIQQIDNTQMVHVAAVTHLAAAKESMLQGKVQGFLYIREGMEKKVLSLQQTNMVLAVNAARFLPSSDVMGTITQVGLTVGAGVRLQYLQKKGMNTEASLQEVMPVKPDFRPLFNNRTDYGTFLLPGLLAMILQQTLLLGLAGGIAAERQRGTVMLQTSGTGESAASFSAWMNPGASLSSALWGKGLFYFILFSCYAFFFLTVNFGVLDLRLLGNPWELGIVTALFLLSLIPMGIFIGLLFRSQLLCTQLMAFSTYPIFLITGYTWPIQQLPDALKIVSGILPITPFLSLYQGIVQQGAHISDRMPELFHLCALWLFYTFICLMKMRKLS
ncbi:ABC transporter permease [Chitinophaga niabensis]|uniref:ABC-2 type transport system permease protein n=1 Tax=Chitinophaga niabensis TaxID=536979 RepID=A0A1N6DNJ8_9BACT|nr:ABC transporter permease [Chitinophaga niabensis]SIN72316.1 ABC-2 type transport system permease protein [Chitinophaga niabensis]